MWPYPKILAHRGGGTLAPENTLAALRCGLAHGFHAVEFDVMLAADGVPVVVHDTRLGRTVIGVGNVPDFTARQLAAMDAGTWFGPQFAGEGVPSFAAFFQFCRAHRIWMNVEIKPAKGFEEATGRIVAKHVAQWLAADPLPHGEQLPLLSSFSFDAVMAAKAAAPHIPRGYLLETVPSDWRERLVALDAVALHTNQKTLTPEMTAAIKQAGYGLFCYTVNDPQRARQILKWGVDAFCTDRIDLIGADFA